MKLILFVFVLVCFAQKDFNFIIVTDIHIDNTTTYPNSTQFAKKTVSYLNDLATKEKISFCIFTGDLTDKATMYKEFREIFNNLKIPYLPLPGNHDILRNAVSWVESKPTGDLLFGETFKDLFQKFPVKVEWNSQPTYNEEIKSMSHFQNFHFKFGEVIFIGLDFVSRFSGRPVYNGVIPNALLHEFPGGTFHWLQQELPKIAQEQSSQIVFLQHHPFSVPPSRPALFFGFLQPQKDKLISLYQKHLPKEKIFGMFGGHVHRFFNGSSFDNWKEFRQWETRANGRQPVFSFVKVQNSKISSLREIEIN